MIKKMGLIALLASVIILQGISACGGDSDCDCSNECDDFVSISKTELRKNNNSKVDKKEDIPLNVQAFLGLVTLDGSSVKEMMPAIQVVMDAKKKEKLQKQKYQSDEAIEAERTVDLGWAENAAQVGKEEDKRHKSEDKIKEKKAKDQAAQDRKTFGNGLSGLKGAFSSKQSGNTNQGSDK